MILMKDLNREQEMILLMSRMSMSEAIVNRIDTLIRDKELNWNYILQVCIKNKILGLFWGNIVRLKYVEYLPSKILQVMKFHYLGIKNRTVAYIKEAESIMRVFEERNMKAAFLKGAYLVPHMYKEYGLRNMNDIDIMIGYQDSKEISDIMGSLGYVQGEYHYEEDTIVPFSRQKQILWKMQVNNMAPFLKRSENDYINCYKVDFCMSLDLKLKREDVENLLNKCAENALTPSIFFLHLCCHFYKEAVNLIWIYNNNDINLIKLCDLREYVITHMTEEDIIQTIQLANELDYSEAVYYAFYCLQSIFSDGFEDRYMELLQIKDKEFVNFFGKRDLEQERRWEKGVLDRIFSVSNRDELRDDLPKYRMMS